MAGLYLHIPFCSSRCIYCGFFSTTRLSERQRYVDAMCREMRLRNGASRIDTVYLGGGTPSQLSGGQLRQLFASIYYIYNVSDDAEVTMECNPDDVTASFVDVLSGLPVNRISMGAQTFSDERLRFLRRRHRARQVCEAVSLLRSVGIGNISIDLMYGFPQQTLDEWHADIDAALALDVEHLSAYALSYEEGTVLWSMLQRHQVEELDEELQRRMYYDLKDRLEAAGYEHYELSNFAKKKSDVPFSICHLPSSMSPSFRSRHNSGYWNHTPYIGIGAGAHSFDGRRRQWNVADLSAYMKAMEENSEACEFEQIDETTCYNELVMTALRTCEGLPLSLLTEAQRDYCLRQARRYLECGWLSVTVDGRLRLTRDGLFVSDMVMSDLMMLSP